MTVMGAASLLRLPGAPNAARGWLYSLLQQGDAIWPGVCSAAPSFVRQQHNQVAVPSRSVVPEDILRELRQLDAAVSAGAQLDGRRRNPLSCAALPPDVQLPEHAIEDGLPVLQAHVRAGAGRIFCKWLRKAGRAPARVYSLPGEQELLLHLADRDLGKLVLTYGRNGVMARVLRLDLVAPPPGSPLLLGGQAGDGGSSGGGAGGEQRLLGSIRVKPVQVYINAATQQLEGLDLLYCPLDRVVDVDVPVKLLNDDAAPGVRKGGWMSMLKRTVRYRALGSSVPPAVEVNVRHLELETELLVRELPVPPGTKLAEKDFNAPVVRCTTDVGKD